MAQNDFFEGIVFRAPDKGTMSDLRSLTAGQPQALGLDSVLNAGALASEAGKMLRSMQGGCRLAAPPSEIFEVAAGENGDLVTRCGHHPHHEWHGRTRVK